MVVSRLSDGGHTVVTWRSHLEHHVVLDVLQEVEHPLAQAICGGEGGGAAEALGRLRHGGGVGE
eukprot:2230237-Prymnesium_polylepis.1